jgi:hypothetical protein
VVRSIGTAIPTPYLVVSLTTTTNTHMNYTWTPVVASPALVCRAATARALPTNQVSRVP